MSQPSTIDLSDLGLDQGGHILVQRALGPMKAGDELWVQGDHPLLGVHLSGWCRAHGHHLSRRQGGYGVVKGATSGIRWAGATRAGHPDSPDEVASPAWGLAARGALVEGGGPELASDLVHQVDVWADVVPKLYAQAVADQWDPATAVDWDEPFDLPDEVEASVVQVMTFLIENELAALVVPARFVARIHPHFREVLQLLAVQLADEARHVEVFTRRALLRTDRPGSSTVGGRASLHTLTEESDFSLSSLLLSVLGEGTFLNLLSFLHRHAPDPVTARVAQLALQDEGRHVAFGIGHLEAAVRADRQLLGRMRSAMERRHHALAGTDGLNSEVFDALVTIAAGGLDPASIRRGWSSVVALESEMDEGRRRRLTRIGFPPDEAAELSTLHTRNFM